MNFSGSGSGDPKRHRCRFSPLAVLGESKAAFSDAIIVFRGCGGGCGKGCRCIASRESGRQMGVLEGARVRGGGPHWSKQRLTSRVSPDS